MVGNSFGGALSAQFALEFPNKVKKLILISPMVNWFKGKKKAKLFRIPFLGYLIYKYYGINKIQQRALSFIESLPPKDKLKYKIKIENNFSKENLFFWKSLFLKINSNAFDDYTQTFIKLGGTNKKMALIWGTDDTEVSQADISLINNSFKNIKYEEVKGGSHALIAESPLKIIDFISKSIDHK